MTSDENVASSGVARLREQERSLRSESLMTKALRRLRRDRLTMISLMTILFFVVLSVAAPVISDALGVDPTTTDGRNNFLPICNPFADVDSRAQVACELGHYLGTDNLGRDHLSRLLYAGQISLAIGFVSAIVTVVIGLILGMATGYFGGILDDFINWVITTLNSVPSLYLLIAISAIFRPSPEALILVFAIVGWTGDTRLIRGQTFAIRDLDYVMAARALGAPPLRIMRQHVFPNLISILAVSLALSIGGIILAEAALSFLSLGVQPPTPTWGNMLTESQNYFRNDAFHLALFPGLLITITVLCLYIIGDGVRDAFDPTVND